MGDTFFVPWWIIPITTLTAMRSPMGLACLGVEAFCCQMFLSFMNSAWLAV